METIFVDAIILHNPSSWGKEQIAAGTAKDPKQAGAQVIPVFPELITEKNVRLDK